MSYRKLAMKKRKSIALVAHDHEKQNLLDWVRKNKRVIAQHKLYATGTTGRMLERRLGLNVIKVQSGPLGGDLQIGARIADGEINFLIFFWDPLAPMPHDPDVKALLRIAAVWNIPVASNRASADFMISSPFLSQPYQRLVRDYRERER